jgi:hypothetical protein
VKAADAVFGLVAPGQCHSRSGSEPDLSEEVDRSFGQPPFWDLFFRSERSFFDLLLENKIETFYECESCLYFLDR